MNTHKRRHVVAAFVLAFMFSLRAFAGYTLKTLASFPGGTEPALPASRLTVMGNTVFGTTPQAGANIYNGSVFSVPISGGPVTTLASFNGTNGDHSYSGLTVVGNSFYGTTFYGGATGGGVVFSVPINGGTPNVLTSLNSTTGQHPECDLLLVGNKLYGTTEIGGAYGNGTVFSIPVSGGAPTVLASFNGTNGANPQAGLILSGNTLYGTAAYGGTNNSGTVFSLPLTGGTPTVLAAFKGSDGANPVGALTLVGQTLYGTTDYGGTAYNGSSFSGEGVVFSLPIGGGTTNVLAYFNGPNGSHPFAGLAVSGNKLYGTTSYGGSTSHGTVFSIPVGGGPLAVIASFNGSNGNGPEGSLAFSGTTILGTTSSGGVNNGGTVFSLVPNPIVSLTSTVPVAFGAKLGALAVTKTGGVYDTPSTSFNSTSTGYVAITGFNPATDPETYAISVSDSNPANLDAALAALADEINGGSYSGFSVAASTIDPFGGTVDANVPPYNYNFYLTFTNLTVGTGSPYFGFDLTQLNGNTDTLTATAVAVVPEPAVLPLAAAGIVLVFGRRRLHRT